jgi:hypothetical protein
MNKTFFPFVVAVGMFAASPSWAVGGEGGRAVVARGLEGGVQVAGGMASTVVASAEGLLYGGQGVSAQLMGRGSASADKVRSVAQEGAVKDDTEGGLAQILSGLALAVLLIGKRISG